MIPFIFNKVTPLILKELGLDGVKWGHCRVMVVVGDNAGGKSLLRRLFQTFLKKNKSDQTEVIHLSQQGRSTSGFVRTVVYGSEDDGATSVISARTLVNSIRTSRGRENKHFIIYDEPEIGMSDESDLGAAIWLKEQLQDCPEQLRGIIICTHSRQFASQLMKLPYSKFIWMHHPEATVREWLDRTIKPIDPQKLMDVGLARWRKITKIFEKNRKKNQK